jgi:hypothetical protein
MDHLLIVFLNAWVTLEFWAFPYWGFVAGSAFVLAWILRDTTFCAPLGWIAVIATAVPCGLIFWLPAMTASAVGQSIDLPAAHGCWFFCALPLPPAAFFLLSRYGGEVWAGFTHRLTKGYRQQRDGRTDIRTVSDSLPGALPHPYDPLQHINIKRGIFLGLDVGRKPIHLDWVRWRKSHIQVVGTTGSGKGVIAGTLLYQAIQAGEAAIVIDPKDDEYLPHVLCKAAQDARVPYVYLDMQSLMPQWSPFRGKSEQAIEELLTAGFRMGEKGTDADFYRLDDRRMARRFASFAATYGGTLNACFRDFYRKSPSLIEEAKMLYADLEELAITPCAQAAEGLDISGLIEAGAVIYVRGTVRNPRILKLQRIFLLSCMQFIGSRNRDTARYATIFMDEFKYMLSRASLEALGAIRDKRAHVMVAHQSLGDLEDCGGDLTPQAVIGGVVENCAIKLAYKVMDPNTAEWLSRMSGTILVDDETRTIERNIGLTETQTGQRTLRQSERPLIDVNQLLMLPDRSAALFGIGPGQFVYTSPIQVTKTVEAISPRGELLPEERRATTGGVTLGEALLDVD